MELRDQLFETLTGYWDLQVNNYDIELNYPELLDIQFDDPGLTEKLKAAAKRCRDILSTEKPKTDPDTEAIFREGIAPVPNNSVLNIVTRAILCGGPDFKDKPGGWYQRRGKFIFEKKQANAGDIEIMVEDEGMVQGFTLFTLDVLMVLLGHVSKTYCESKTGQPLSLKSIISSREILKYKRVTSYGRKRWSIFENIHAEVERLRKIEIKVRNARGKDQEQSYSGKLVLIKDIKRDFNPSTKHYVTTSWEIRPGSWANYLMSEEGFAYIGKLNQDVLALDHREQRGAQSFAKKIMYSFFVLPGGTYYIKNGAKKSFRQLLEMIGEYRQSEGVDRKAPMRNLKRLGKALDLLVSRGEITINIEGGTEKFIDEHRRPWGTHKLMQKIVEIKKI